MSYETRDLTGKLFKNDRKTKDGQPDYTGECVIEGQAYFMDAWLKASERGTKWMSFSFKAKTTTAAKPSKPPPPRSALPPGRDLTDDIPF